MPVSSVSALVRNMTGSESAKFLVVAGAFEVERLRRRFSLDAGASCLR